MNGGDGDYYLQYLAHYRAAPFFADMDGGSDVDLGDFAEFQNSFTGAE